jgi:hypothetical protein
LAALDPALRQFLAMRCGSHPDMLALSIAGFVCGQMTATYRARLAEVSAIDAALPHLAWEVDERGVRSVRIIEDAFDMSGLIAKLQLATREHVLGSAAARTVADRVFADVLDSLLDELEADTNLQPLAALSDVDFAELVRARARLTPAASRIHPAVLDYVQTVTREAVERARLDEQSLPDLERLLGLRPLEPDDTARLLQRSPRPTARGPQPAVVTNGLAPFPSNHAAWALLDAIRGAVLGQGWDDRSGSRVPMHRTATNKGRGTVHVSLRAADGGIDPPGDALPVLWEKVRALDDLTSDALLACLAAWTAEGGQPDRAIWITADAVLDARGLQRIQRRGEPRTWQHGHRREDRMAVGRALAQLDSLWLEIVDVEVMPGGRNRQPKRLTVESRAMAVLDRLTERDAEGNVVFLAARVMPGEWARAYWELGLRQVGWLAQQALAYDPYHERPEKWLAKYLAFQFRWNARNQAAPLRRRVVTLLTNAGLEPDPARPQRARDRLEKALNRLQEDNLLDGWGYEADTVDLPARRWLPSWLEMIVWLEPPAALKERYTRLGSKRPPASSSK